MINCFFFSLLVFSQCARTKTFKDFSNFANVTNRFKFSTSSENDTFKSFTHFIYVLQCFFFFYNQVMQVYGFKFIHFSNNPSLDSRCIFPVWVPDYIDKFVLNRLNIFPRSMHFNNCFCIQQCINSVLSVIMHLLTYITYIFIHSVQQWWRSGMNY